MAAAREGEYPRTVLVGLLLGIWPHLVSRPSIPLGAATLWIMYLILVWKALAL